VTPPHVSSWHAEWLVALHVWTPPPMHDPAARGAPQPAHARPIVSSFASQRSAQIPASVLQPPAPQLPRQHSLPAAGAHSEGAAPRQVPAPSHASPSVHACPSSHATDAPWSAQRPSPSQLPVVPQVAGA
jgi:hypothetical protein